MSVAVLFVRKDSDYKSLPGTDCYDQDRDASKYYGVDPVVAHPPCRGWGKLRGLSKATNEEKHLGVWAVWAVRIWGGVLEHPQASKLWEYCRLPKPGEPRDLWGGFSIDINQHWFGHRAEKRTWLYIVGCEPKDVPAYPIRIDRPERVITNRHGVRKGHPSFKTECTKREREATPIAFAKWLIELSDRCRKVKGGAQ